MVMNATLIHVNFTIDTYLTKSLTRKSEKLFCSQSYYYKLLCYPFNTLCIHRKRFFVQSKNIYYTALQI